MLRELAVVYAEDQEMDSAMSRPGNHQSVIIVGAGLAGLSAAAHLSSLGVKSLILEAQSRPGGRVRSVILPKSPALPDGPPKQVELGATFFHGTRGNAAYDLAVSCGLHKPSALDTEEDEEVGHLLFSSDGKLVKADGTASLISGSEGDRIARVYAKALAQIEDVSKPSHAHPGASVLQHVRKGSDYDLLKQEQRAVFRARDILEATINGCDDSTARLSASLANEYVTLPGANLHMADKGGMSSIVHLLMSKLADESCLRCNAEVTAVYYNKVSQPGVDLHLASGDFITADCLIWTPSLNVTKAACEDAVFHPPLPLAKINALSQRGYGVVDKVFAVLESPLQNVDVGRDLPVYWDGTEDDLLTAEFARTMSSSEAKLSRPAFGEWCCGIYAVSYDAAAVCVHFWLSGTYALKFSERSEERARSELSSLLSVLYEQNVTVHAILRSEWGKNPFTRGSYSYAAVGCPPHAVEQVSDPVPSADLPLLCFAGEATHGRFFSTMHGAIESGIREAERCAQYLAKKEGQQTGHCLDDENRNKLK